MIENIRLQVMNLGRADYKTTWDLQRTLQRKLIDNPDADTHYLILCEHSPTITYGKSSDQKNLLTAKEKLNEVNLFPIERGGDFTYHGPGQLTVYPIIDLKKVKRDVGWYLRSLEEVVIQTLDSFEITGIRSEGRTGVWIKEAALEKKICSIGVRLSRWCTLHGFALNVTNESLIGFQHIIPCGLEQVTMTCLEEHKNITDVDAISNIVTVCFREIFDYSKLS